MYAVVIGNDDVLPSGQIDASDNAIGQGKEVQILEVPVQRFCRQERIENRRPRQQPRHGSRSAVPNGLRPRKAVIVHRGCHFHSVNRGRHG